MGNVAVQLQILVRYTGLARRALKIALVAGVQGSFC